MESSLESSIILSRVVHTMERTELLWIHTENKPSAVKFRIKWALSDKSRPDLDDIRPELCKKGTLKDVEPDDLEFFRYNNRITPLTGDIFISDLNTSATDPLVVRYPLSDSQVIVRCNLSSPWFQRIFPHNSGLWYLIRHAAEEKFEALRKDGLQYFFVYIKDKKKKSDEIEIEDEYALNKIIGNIKPSEDNELKISLSIRIKGKKAYGEWEIGEVLKEFLHQNGSSIGDVRNFNIVDLPPPEPAIADEEIGLLIDELKKNKCAFKLINRNESTCREFISSFMTTAAKHVQSEEDKLLLKVEEWLDGTRGFGPTDYAFYIDYVIALVAKAKKENFEKGAAQNIVQMHSAIETLTPKRKKDDEKGDDVPVLMYGIVTNALNWLFIRWAGSLEDPTLEVSGPHPCEFDSNDMTQAKQIVGYIVSILQQQVRGLTNEENRFRIKKRHCITSD